MKYEEDGEGNIVLFSEELIVHINTRFKNFYIETKPTGRKIDWNGSGVFYLQLDDAIAMAEMIISKLKEWF